MEAPAHLLKKVFPTDMTRAEGPQHVSSQITGEKAFCWLNLSR